MNAEVWRRVRPILTDALDLVPERRSEFLDGACGSDASLRAHLQSLVNAAETGSILADPVDGGLAIAIGDAAGLSAVGARIGQYRLKRLIGVGGMGAVYEAVQDHPRRTVAVKILRAGLTSRSAQRRFEYEAQLLGRLRHPGVAQIFEAGIHQTGAGPVAFFAMEYIAAARPITEFTRERGLDLRARLALFARVCDAVHHGHQKGIVHRDLKPSNILVDGQGQPRIIDFGVARATDSDLALTTLQTEVGQLIGTLQYMSPEQAGGSADPNDIDTRSDVYALGVVLFEILTGALPYRLTGVSVLEAPRIIREQQPTRPSAVNPALRGDLQIITLKALAKDRAQRYQSAAELAADLQRFLAGDPIAARPPSVRYQLRLFARRNRSLVISAAAILCALIVGLIAAAVSRDHALRAEAIAHEQAARADRIAAFLKSTIASADPYHSGFGTLGAPSEFNPFGARRHAAIGQGIVPDGSDGPRTLESILRDAAERARVAFADDPGVRAELLHVLSNSLQSRSESGRNYMELLEEAIEIYRRHPDVDPAGAASTLFDLAQHRNAMGGLPEAARLLEEADQICTRAFGPVDPHTIEIRRGLAGVLMNAESSRERALALARQTLQSLRDSVGRDHPRALFEEAALATVLGELGRMEEAESLARHALAGFEQGAFGDPLTIAELRSSLAGVLRARGGRARLSEALTLVTSSLEAWIRTIGSGHSRLLGSRLAVIETASQCGDFDTAARVCRDAVATARRSGIPGLSDLIKFEARLARVLVWKGGPDSELEEAESLARHAAEVSLERIGPTDDYCVYHVATLAAVRRARGHAEEALASCDRLLAMGSAAPWAAAYAGHVRTDALTDLRRYDEAQAALDAAAEAAHKWGDPASPIRVAVYRSGLRLAKARADSEAIALWRGRLEAITLLDPP